MGGFIAAPLPAAGAAAAKPAQTTWSLVQPVPRDVLLDPVVRHYEHHLPRYLGDKVTFQDAGKGEYMDGLHKVLASSSAQQSIVLLSPSLLGYLHEESMATKVAEPLQPLQLVLDRPWCLVGGADLQFKSGDDFVRWLRSQKRPVRVNMLSRDGLPNMWLKGMERKTGVVWNVSTFPVSTVKSLESIAAGQQDLALELCPEVTRVLKGKSPPSWSDKVKVLATATNVPEFSGKVPSFAQWRVPTIQPSWIAWFASSQLPADQQQRLAQALYQVAMREDTQALIRDLYQNPSSMTPQDSQTYIADWLGNWQSIGAWLKSLPADTTVPPLLRPAKPAVIPLR